MPGEQRSSTAGFRVSRIATHQAFLAAGMVVVLTLIYLTSAAVALRYLSGSVPGETHPIWPTLYSPVLDLAENEYTSPAIFVLFRACDAERPLRIKVMNRKVKRLFSELQSEGSGRIRLRP